MKTIELYDVAAMAYVDYDFEKCEHTQFCEVPSYVYYNYIEMD